VAREGKKITNGSEPFQPCNDAVIDVGIRGHMGHIDILVVAVRRLSRRWKVKTLLAGPSPTSPMRRRLPTPLFPTIEGGSETDVLPNRFLTAISYVMSGEKSGLQSSQRNLMEGDVVVEREITSEIAVYTFEILHLKH